MARIGFTPSQKINQEQGPFTRAIKRQAQLRNETEAIAQRLDSPLTRAVIKKSQLREMTKALAEKLALINQKAASIPKELLKNIKL